MTAALLAPRDRFENNLSQIVLGKARPKRTESADTVEDIKVQMDLLNPKEIPNRGMAGLVDCLWTLVV